MTQRPLHRPDRRAINTISTMKMARLNPTIHPKMATSHELAGNRVAHHTAMADANKAKAELAPTAQVLSAGGAISGNNQKTSGTRAIRAKDKPAPNSSALSKPFMKLMIARDGGLVCGIHHKTCGLPQVNSTILKETSDGSRSPPTQAA